MGYKFLGSISACLPRGSAMASLVTICSCAETQISNKHCALCCWCLWEGGEECHLQMLLCLHRGALQVWVLGPATQSTGVTSGKSSWVSQVSNSSALLMSGSGINMGWALLVDLCTHFKCEFIRSLEMAKGSIWSFYYYYLKKQKTNKQKTMMLWSRGKHPHRQVGPMFQSCICFLNGRIVHLGSRGILCWCQDSGEV